MPVFTHIKKDELLPSYVNLRKPEIRICGADLLAIVNLSKPDISEALKKKPHKTSVSGPLTSDFSPVKFGGHSLGQLNFQYTHGISGLWYSPNLDPAAPQKNGAGQRGKNLHGPDLDSPKLERISGNVAKIRTEKRRIT